MHGKGKMLHVLKGGSHLSPVSLFCTLKTLSEAVLLDNSVTRARASPFAVISALRFGRHVAAPPAPRRAERGGAPASRGARARGRRAVRGRGAVLSRATVAVPPIPPRSYPVVYSFRSRSTRSPNELSRMMPAIKNALRCASEPAFVSTTLERSSPST